MRAQRAVVGAHVDRIAQRTELIDTHGLGRGAKAQEHVDGHTLLGKLTGKAQHGRNTDAAATSSAFLVPSGTIQAQPGPAG